MTFYEVLNEAIDDLLEYGFDSEERLNRWLTLLAQAMRGSLVPEKTLQRALRDVLERTFKKYATPAALLRLHNGIEAFTLKQIQPKLREELDRRIFASANLIKLNRQASIQRTLQRFAGWATSVPRGGTEAQTRKSAKEEIKRGIGALPFEERRVVIDQGHKLVAAINEIVAVDGGAIAAIWRHVPERRPAYDARPQHVARHGKIYLLRNSWARTRGFVKGGAGLTDEVTQPGEEIFCRCFWEFLYTLRDLPTDMLTTKGKEALLEARATIRSLTHATHR